MMLKNNIISAYEKITGYSLSEDDPIVAISFIFKKILEEQDERLAKKYNLIIGIVGILSFLIGLSVGILF